MAPSWSLRMVAHRRTCQNETRHAGEEPARDHAADGAEAANIAADHPHRRDLNTMRPPDLALTRPACQSQARLSAPKRNGDLTVTLTAHQGEAKCSNQG